MKKVYVVLLAGVLGLLGACNSEERIPVVHTPEVVPSQEITLPAVETDAVSVVTFKDYQAAKQAAWVVYSETKTKNYNEYYEAKIEALRKWQAVDQAELRILRAVDRENYLKWLDASKINDSYVQYELETSVPAIIAYKSKSGEAYKAYETLQSAAYQSWEDANAKAYQAYEASVAKSYDAYESHK